MQKTSQGICRKCIDKEIEAYHTVRDYLHDHPDDTIYEVSENTGVDVLQIEILIQSGRLEQAGLKILHKCNTCESIISQGRFCSECNANVCGKIDDLPKTFARPGKIESKHEIETKMDDRFHRFTRK
ncbi:hypothetical protein HYY75_03800 [bacterium]|nr:hypothetical protein [bacterium]